MEVAARSSSSGLAEQFMYKNRLQEYAQKSSIPLPSYQTVNEGSPHAPQFRSTVMIDGVTFRSYRTFFHRKEAEQDVAKLALEGISRKIKHDGVSLISEDPIFCKSILYEYAVKMNKETPTYTTSQAEGILPVFVTSLVFDGKNYTGGAGKNKKVAEQMAARTVIESILANSNTRTLMSQIINSKGKLYATLHKGSHSESLQARNLAMKMHSQNSSTKSKGKEVQANLTHDKLPGNGVACSVAGQLANAAEAPSFPPEAKKPDDEYICKPSSGTAESDSQGVVLDGGKKRSNEDQGGRESKKTRADGRLPCTPPVEL